MSDAHPTDHAATSAAPAHDDGGHDDGGHGHDAHGHDHDAGALGPLDPAAWGAGLLGVLLGGVTALAFALSTGWIAL